MKRRNAEAAASPAVPTCAGCGDPGRLYAETSTQHARVAAHCVRCSWILTGDADGTAEEQTPEQLAF